MQSKSAQYQPKMSFIPNFTLWNTEKIFGQLSKNSIYATEVVGKYSTE